MNATKFSMTRDINGFNGFGLPFTNNGISTSLTANAEQHFTVSSEYPHWIAVFSFTPASSVYVDNLATAVVPGSSFAASTSELNPAARYVKAGSTLSFITADTNSPTVQVSLFVAPYFGN